MSEPFPNVVWPEDADSFDKRQQLIEKLTTAVGGQYCVFLRLPRAQVDALLEEVGFVIKNALAKVLGIQMYTQQFFHAIQIEVNPTYSSVQASDAIAIAIAGRCPNRFFCDTLLGVSAQAAGWRKNKGENPSAMPGLSTDVAQKMSVAYCDLVDGLSLLYVRQQLDRLKGLGLTSVKLEALNKTHDVPASQVPETFTDELVGSLISDISIDGLTVDKAKGQVHAASREWEAMKAAEAKRDAELP